MVDALPWVISTVAVLAVLVMTLLQGCRRRRAGEAPRGRTRADAAATRKAIREATRATRQQLAEALDGDDPEGDVADAANAAQDRR